MTLTLQLTPALPPNHAVLPHQIPGSDEYRFNFWGYSTVGFFAPMSRFSEAAARGADGEAIKVSVWG